MLAVRLFGSSSDGIQGEVGTFDKTPDPSWKPLCDDGWNLKSASVVCRQLNLGPPVSIYSHVHTVPSNQNYFNRITESDKYGIEGLVCNGTESNIAQCQYNNVSSHGCHENETAGVICSPSKVLYNLGIMHVSFVCVRKLVINYIAIS